MYSVTYVTHTKTLKVRLPRRLNHMPGCSPPLLLHATDHSDHLGLVGARTARPMLSRPPAPKPQTLTLSRTPPRFGSSRLSSRAIGSSSVNGLGTGRAILRITGPRVRGLPSSLPGFFKCYPKKRGKGSVRLGWRSMLTATLQRAGTGGARHAAVYCGRTAGRLPAWYGGRQILTRSSTPVPRPPPTHNREPYDTLLYFQHHVPIDPYAERMPRVQF
jgi:hypothetical protein